MSLVTVKPKFQVTIPAKLRKGMDLREGDLMEATIVQDGILLRPVDVVDNAAGRIEVMLREAEPSNEDAKLSENEVMEDVISDITKARRQHRKR